MPSPGIQYLTTSDGMNIGHAICGSGRPLVLMPFPFSNLHLMWSQGTSRGLLDALAARFRLVQYDSRGQGMSTRGLPDGHCLDDYVTDLEAVVDHLGLDRFILYGGPLFANVAVRYAVKHPDSLLALVLADAGLGDAWSSMQPFAEVARSSWDLFIHTAAAAFSAAPGTIEMIHYFRESTTQADFLKVLDASRNSGLAAIAPNVTVPTLVIAANPTGSNYMGEAPKDLAAAIPGAHLVLLDDWPYHVYGRGTETPPVVLAIEEFIKGLQPDEKNGPILPAASRRLPAGLSDREAEVLRLVAAGKSNQQIADVLFISMNTVARHVSNIFDKIEASSRAEAISYAHRHNLI